MGGVGGALRGIGGTRFGLRVGGASALAPPARDRIGRSARVIGALSSGSARGDVGRDAEQQRANLPEIRTMESGPPAVR
ncbi:hypothetical protein GCM10010515_42400 [Streptomyces fructofermentans]|uniref:Uncharacterized protein n=1 Tax=Streptomyces fructofermentans TaxID=152141 RepID=A0A918KNV8_9ACTN|nr:hypothetical protein GCM10010515_42400 [Streptomyces fructofermentans]